MTARTPLIRSQRFWLLVALAVLGIVYSVLITRYYQTKWVFSLIPLMQRSFLLEALIRFFWSGIALAPITVALTLLRVRLAYAALTVLIFLIIMNAVVFSVYRWNFATFMSLAVVWPWNFAMQVPVWWLTRLLTGRAVRTD